jgi:serine/threonine protein kinase/Tfp pilus assembly protein PilF
MAPRSFHERLPDAVRSACGMGNGSPTRVGPLPERLPPSVVWNLPQNGAGVPACALPEGCPEPSGFELLATLGEGAFGRVFLARQADLAGRLVALKVSSEAVGEARLLAQLLHSNIVPIYSVHRLGDYQAVCMPYLGATTLADLLREVRQSGLPQSGKHLVSTLLSHTGTRKSSFGLPGSYPISLAPEGYPGPGIAPSACPVAGPGPGTRAVLDRLQGMTYVEAMLWAAAQLADGLEHAHDRGIIHRDLKPANVLLTDEGQPVLLDFNLAEDIKGGAERARLGGTLPYMAPEQLQALQLGCADNSPSSDLYSLGLILFELLTGRFPFPSYSGPTREVLPKLIASRSAPPPPLRCWNRDITPAVEAIVQRCLEPDPARRYRSARQLQDDLERQREHRPLRFAPNTSLRERAAKWVRRHPRLTSMSSALTLGLVLSIGLAVLASGYKYRVQWLEAEQALAQFRDEAMGAQIYYAGPTLPDAREAARRSERALERYGALSNPRWREATPVERLPAEKRQALEETVGGLFLVLARTEAMKALALPPGPEREAILQEAIRHNERAEENGAARHLPVAFHAQKAELLTLTGQEDGKVLQELAGPARNERDTAMTARELITHGKYAEAQALLVPATRQAPDDPGAWFLLGRCHEAMGRDKEALACYSVVLGLKAQTAPAFFRRGLIYLRQNEPTLAHADFTQALELEPDNGDAFINRALARHALKQLPEAVADLTRALELDVPYTRVYFMRAQMRELAGDSAGARADRAEGLRREPTDEESWVSRGVQRLGKDAPGALEDFREALKLNPTFLPALVNGAVVLRDCLGKPEEALELLDRAVAAHPDQMRTRATRALLLARLGKRDAAFEDAERVVRSSPDGFLLFTLASVYAQTSRAVPSDGKDATRFLALAMRKGYGHDQIDRNADLIPLHELSEFRRLVEAARALR